MLIYNYRANKIKKKRALIQTYKLLTRATNPRSSTVGSMNQFTSKQLKRQCLDGTHLLNVILQSHL